MCFLGAVSGGNVHHSMHETLKLLILDLLPKCSADEEAQLPSQASQCGNFGG
jgi:hypothetical protein